MSAEVIAIGDELTSGQRLDTNSRWLSQQLGDLGIPVLYHSTVVDDLDAITEVLRHAAKRAKIIVVTGGLGPTADDLTRQAIAAATATELVLDEAQLTHIRQLFSHRKRAMPQQNVIQAMFPRGSHVIPNPHGTAPGIDMEIVMDDRPAARIFALPGVPAEMHEMWQATVSPTLRELAGPKPRVIRHRRIHCFGTGESDIEQRLPDLVRRGRVPSVGITASQATITLRISAEGPNAEACRQVMEPTAATIYECLGSMVFGEDDDQLQDVVLRVLANRGQTLATVECDAGGILAHWLSTADQAKQVYCGGQILHRPVSRDIGLGHSFDPKAIGERSERRIAELAEQCRRQYAVDYALALGPFPQPSPAGANAADYWIAIAGPDGLLTKKRPFSGHPAILVSRAVKEALNFLRLQLSKA